MAGGHPSPAVGPRAHAARLDGHRDGIAGRWLCRNRSRRARRRTHRAAIAADAPKRAIDRIRLAVRRRLGELRIWLSLEKAYLARTRGLARIP